MTIHPEVTIVFVQDEEEEPFAASTDADEQSSLATASVVSSSPGNSNVKSTTFLLVASRRRRRRVRLLRTIVLFLLIGSCLLLLLLIALRPRQNYDSSHHDKQAPIYSQNDNKASGSGSSSSSNHDQATTTTSSSSLSTTTTSDPSDTTSTHQDDTTTSSSSFTTTALPSLTLGTISHNMFGQYVALNGPGNAMAIVRAAGDWQVFDATFTQATAGRNNTNTNEDNGDGRNSGDDKDDKMEWEARPSPPTMLDTNDQRSLAAHSRRYLRQTDQDESDKDSTTTTTLTTQMIALSNDGRQVAVADSVFKSSTTAEASAVTPLPEIRMWKYGSSTISDNDGDVWERVGNVVTEFTLKHGTKVLALAVSADGQTLAVGGAGYIRVLRFIPGSNRWMPRGQILLASSFDWDEESLSLFGSKLAMSENGRILVTLTDSATLAMFEWKYESNFWNLQPIIPSSGSTEPITAFALSAVGTRVAYASGGTAVYVYDYVPLQSVWYQRGQAITHASDSSATFGSAIALSGDGSLLVVGTPDLGAGQVFFYGLVSNEWVQVYEVSLGITDGDRWGAFVTISRDGSTVAITADQQGQTVPNLGYVGILTIPSS